MKFIIRTIMCFLVGSLSSAYALDSSSQEALQKTVELLKDKTSRDKMIQSSPQAQKIKVMMQQLGVENEQEIFELAASVLSGMAKTSNGDAKKMMAETRKDPKSFIKNFNGEQMRQLREIANKIQGAQEVSKP